jgi:hypothetical protein
MSSGRTLRLLLPAAVGVGLLVCGTSGARGQADPEREKAFQQLGRDLEQLNSKTPGDPTCARSYRDGCTCVCRGHEALRPGQGGSRRQH